MHYVIVTPGGTVQYDVPIMKVQTYSLDDIFGKGLLMLIPFYIFSHENSFPEYNSNEQKLAELKAEYQKILERLDELEQQGVIGADKRTIIEISGDVIKEIAQKYENVQKTANGFIFDWTWKSQPTPSRSFLTKLIRLPNPFPSIMPTHFISY